MNIKLFSSLSLILIVCILGVSTTGLSNLVFGVDQSTVSPNDFSSLITDIDKNVKILTISGKDNSGNTLQIDLILNKDVMAMHQMMMQHMSMMGGMMNSGSNTGMGGMMNSGTPGSKFNNTLVSTCPYIQMLNFMKNQYLIEGGMITIGSSSYQIDSGNTRIVDDKIFLNVHAGSFKAGKIILYGKLNQDGGLKGLLSLPETKNISKISGTGSLANAFQ